MNEEKKRFRGSPNAPQKARIEDRAAQILRLRREGKSVRDISEELGVARTTVHDALVSAMRALREENRALAEHVLDLELERLDSMLDAIKAKIQGGDVKAIDTALKIGDQRAKLLGLYKPQKVEHSGAIVTPEQAAAFAQEAFGSPSPLSDASSPAAPSADGAPSVAPDAVPVSGPVDH